MAFDFPRSSYNASDGNSINGWSSSPSNGDTASAGGYTFTYNGTSSLWGMNSGQTKSFTGAATYIWDGEKWNASNIPDNSNTIFTSDTPLDGEVLKFESSGSTFVFDNPQNLIPDSSASQSGMMTAAQFTKLAGIEAAADVTDAANVDAAGAVMNSDTSTASMSFVVDEDNMSSNNATKVPTQQSVKSYVDNQVASVVDSAPATLDTLNELAAALGDDANFATTVTTNLAAKLPLSGGTMTGNIVMSGSQTVDGRDLSADGSKLDGIEANATADQTAAEIRTLVESATDSNVFTDADHTKLNGIAAGAEVNVQSDWNASSGDAAILNKPTIPTNNNQLTNGAGYITSADGGDAATLDSIDSSSFLRSDAADTASGVITHTNQLIVDHNTGTMLEIKPYNGGPWALGINRDDLSQSRVFAENPSSQGVGWAFEHRPYHYNGGAYDKILTTADEGTGNGLDADTLDGQEGSYYSNYNNLTNKPTLYTNSSVDAHLNQSSASTGQTLIWNGSDYSWGTPAASYGNSNVDSHLNRSSASTGQSLTWNGSDYAWATVSGSGGDADTVDGIQAASFLRSDAADIKSAGDLRWNDGVYAKFGTNEDLEITHTSGNSHIRTVSGSAGDLYIQSQGTGHDLYLRATDDVFIQPQGGEDGIKVIGDGGVELYHNNSKKFETTSVGNTSTGPLTINGTGQHVGNWGYNTLVLVDHSGYPGITWQHGTNNWLQRMENTTDMQWAFRSGGNYTERMQLTTGGVLTVNSNTVWHAGNDGSGSGLDADTVDGIQASSFLRSDANDSFSGTLTGGTIHISGQIMSSSAALQVNGFMRTGDIYIHEGGGSPSSNAKPLQNNSGSLEWDGSTIWTSTNDGAGSGLDADTLDGVQGSNYMGKVGSYWNANTWLQFSSTHGLYYPNNNSYHVYLDGAYLRIQNSANSNGIKIITNNSSQRGFLYADNGSNIGLLNSGGSWSLKCDNSGNVTATGNVTAYSDLRIKENIRTVDNALDKVQSMRGVYFDRKDTGKASVGVIAQEIEQILPEVVETQDTRTDENKDGLSDLKTVSYGNIVGVLIEAIKELRAEVAELKEAN